MQPYGNEDIAWQRLVDVQREADNRRLIKAGGAPSDGWLPARHAVQSAWSAVRWASGKMFVRRRPWPGPDCGEAEASTDVA